MWSEFIFLVLIIFKAEARLPRHEAPQTILVNNMVVPAVRVDQTEKDVDFTAEYHYVDGDKVNVACVNLLDKDKALLTMEYEMAGTTSDKSTVNDISSSKMIGIVTTLHVGHNNSYMICTNTGTTDYTKVMIRFVMLTKPNSLSILINGMTLRPILTNAVNRYYEIKYLSISHQRIHVKYYREARTNVEIHEWDTQFGETVSLREGLKHMSTSSTSRERSFNLNPGEQETLDIPADYTEGLAESVHIEFTTANLPNGYFSSVHMELPPSGTVMKLYSYKYNKYLHEYKLSFILYELKQNETLHLTCGPLPSGSGLYLQLNNTEKCHTDGCNLSTTLQHVSREHVHPPIVCSLKEAHDSGLPSTTIDPVFKEIRVILLSTTLTAKPPSSNTNTRTYGLIAAGIVIVIIILVIVIKKQYCVRLSLPIPAPRIDPASVFYVNLLSLCRPINEREAAALPENHYEEILHGDLTNQNSNSNKFDNHLLNRERHHYTEIDYARCKPEGTEAPHENNFIYHEPYPH